GFLRFRSVRAAVALVGDPTAYPPRHADDHFAVQAVADVDADGLGNARTASVRTELHALSPQAGPGFDARCSVLFHQKDPLRGLARAQRRVRGGIHQPAPGPVAAAGDAVAAGTGFNALAAGDGGAAYGRQH